MVDGARRVELKGLFGPRANFHDLPWKVLREGIDIVQLYGTPQSGPSAALLRYRPGATVPTHRHGGYEHILVLESSQSDDNGVAEAGTLVINPPGTSHQVVSEKGCIVLAIWHGPIEFAV